MLFLHIPTWRVCAALLYALCAPVAALAVDTSGIRAELPDEAKLQEIEASIRAEPQNLDHYYAYATMAAQIREYDKAASMYQRMLTVAPDLPRVKLELAMTYMQLKRFDDAERLVDEVLKGDIPPEVRRNLEPMKAQLQEATRRHVWGGSVATGLYADSNANAAPNNGIVTLRFAGEELPFELSKDGKKRSDMQAFAVANVTHQYRPQKELSEGVQAGWQSSASYYRNQYRNLSNLNIQVASVRTGPTITAMDGKLQAGATAGYNFITLDGHSYQRQYVGELTLGYVVDAATRLRLIPSKEWRDYINAPTINSFTLRDGQAEQVRFGVTHQLTDKDTLDAEVTIRREGTQRRFFDNHQQEIRVGYTRELEQGWFAGADASLRTTEYDQPDFAISTKQRKEQEWSAGVNVGKSFENNVTATAGYEYRDVNANISNYRYTNHRVNTSLGYRF
jgi:Tetratricopeptide repeat